MSTNGFSQTDAAEQAANGAAAGRAIVKSQEIPELRIDPEGIAAAIEFDRKMAKMSGPVFGAFHTARADVLSAYAESHGA